MTSRLDFCGPLNIKTVEECHERLSAELSLRPAELLLSVAADAAVDLTFIQLIESARHSARQGGLSLALAEPAAGHLEEALRRGGFLQAADDRAFWLKHAEAN